MNKTEPHAPRLAESNFAMSSSLRALRNHCHFDWLIPSASTMLTPALIIMENRETIELMLTIWGQSGKGRSWWAMSVRTRPINDSSAKMQLHVSAVQPFLHNRSEPLANAFQPRATPRKIAARALGNTERHPRGCAVRFFFIWPWLESFSTVVLVGSLHFCCSSGLDCGGPVRSIVGGKSDKVCCQRPECHHTIRFHQHGWSTRRLSRA